MERGGQERRIRDRDERQVRPPRVPPQPRQRACGDGGKERAGGDAARDCAAVRPRERRAVDVGVHVLHVLEDLAAEVRERCERGEDERGTKQGACAADDERAEEERRARERCDGEVPDEPPRLEGRLVDDHEEQGRCDEAGRGKGDGKAEGQREAGGDGGKDARRRRREVAAGQRPGGVREAVEVAVRKVVEDVPETRREESCRAGKRKRGKRDREGAAGDDGADAHADGGHRAVAGAQDAESCPRDARGRGGSREHGGGRLEGGNRGAHAGPCARGAKRWR